MNTVLFVNATIGFSENLFLVYFFNWHKISLVYKTILEIGNIITKINVIP